MKTVCSDTSVCKAFNARSTNLRLIAFSSAGVLLGSPNGWGIAIVGTILFAPTVSEIGTIVHMWTTGNLRSISLTIVAPQRVQVPQVDVNITAVTPSATSLSAISAPKRFAFATAVPLPTVV